jgi:hypothetical protein
MLDVIGETGDEESPDLVLLRLLLLTMIIIVMMKVLI